MTRTAHGFSVIELLMAMAVTATCAAALLSLVTAGQAIARSQPEAADLQQRARVGVQVLGSELALAGAGLDRGPRAGPLAAYFPPVGPSADGGLTIWYVADPDAQGTLAATLDADASIATIEPSASCPVAQPACAFSAGTTAILFDADGCRDVARVEDVRPSTLVLRAAVRGCPYVAGAPVARGEVRTYRVDPVARQLLRRDEATGGTQPVLDNVSDMRVEYLESGRRVRVALRLVSPMLLQVPDLVLTLDTRPPNLQARW